MENPIIMPRLGNDIEEAEVTEWLKSEGDMVREGELVVLITTPKVTTELESPASGVFKKMLVQPGELAAVGATLGVIET